MERKTILFSSPDKPEQRTTEDILKTVYEALEAANIRVQLDDRNEKIGYKIREAQQVDRAPYMLILGAKEAEEGNISVRSRDTGDTETMALDDFIRKVKEEIATRAH